MKDEDKSKEDLLAELETTRCQASRVQVAEAERQRAREELETFLQIISAIVKGLPGGLLVFQYHSPDLLILLNCNPQACSLFHVTAEECRGTRIEEIWPDAEGQGLVEGFLNTAHMGEPLEVEAGIYRYDLQERVLRIRAFSMPEHRLGVYVEERREDPAAEAGRAEGGLSKIEPDQGPPEPQSRRYELLEEEIEGLREAAQHLQDTRIALTRQLDERTAELAAAGEELEAEVSRRRTAEEELHDIQHGLEQRVQTRTGELISSMQLLEDRIEKSDRSQNALRITRDELQERVEALETEIRYLSSRLEAEVSAHRAMDEQLPGLPADTGGVITTLPLQWDHADSHVWQEIEEPPRTEEDVLTGPDHVALQLQDAGESSAAAGANMWQETVIGAEPISEDFSPCRNLIDTAPMGMISFNSSGHILAFNPLMLGMLGVQSPDSTIGTRLHENGSLSESELARAVAGCIESGRSCVHDLAYQGRTGNVLDARVWVFPMMDALGTAVGAHAVMEDISALRLQQGLLIQAERMQAFREAAESMSLRFNNGLRTLALQARAGITCLESGRVPDAAPALDRIAYTTRSLCRTARRLRQLGRAVSRSDRHERHLCDLSALVRETVEMDALWSRPDPNRGGPEVLVALDLAEDCFVEIKPEDVSELLANLLENSVEAMPRGGRISVRTFLEDDQVVMQVQDNGEGVPPLLAERIFEPFWTSREGHEGLGLAVCLAIAHRHGATLSLDRREGQPTTLILRLPYAKPLELEEWDSAEHAETEARRLLLVYDLEPVSRIVSNRLQRLGHATFVVSSAPEALAILESTRIDALICDLALDGRGPLTLISAVRAACLRKALPRPPIIVIGSPKDQLSKGRTNFRRHGDRVVEKPVSIMNLMSVVSEEIEKAASMWLGD